MAVQAPVRYCGRCGAALAPGAVFCGRCGTPVPIQAVAAPPMYQYAAPTPGYQQRRQTRLAPALIAGGLVVALIAVALIVGGIAASQFANGSHSTCISNCSPKLITPLPEEASFHSTAYHFTVNYFSDLNVRAQDASSIELGTKVGTVTIAGSSGGSPQHALDSLVAGLPTSTFQDVTLVANVKGAHLGDQDGLGSVYSANFFGSTQTATKVRVAVIAATRNGVTVTMLAINPADVKNFPNGMPEGQLFDYLCTEFSWS